MKLKHYVTLALAFVLTLAPQAMTFVPPAYRDLASAVMALLSSIYHLFQATPAPAAAVIKLPGRGLTALWVVLVLGALALQSCTSSSLATAESSAGELVSYGIPYTQAKMTAACARPSSDVIAATACLNMKTFAAFCLANLPQQAQGVNAAIGAAGAVGAATGNAAVATGAAVAAAANTALVPAFSAAQLAQCASGGFPMASAAH